MDKKKLIKQIKNEIAPNLMLKINDIEAKKIADLITNSVSKITAFKKIDTTNIKPMNYPLITVNQNFREDKIIDFDNKKNLLKAAYANKKNEIKV